MTLGKTILLLGMLTVWLAVQVQAAPFGQYAGRSPDKTKKKGTEAIVSGDRLQSYLAIVSNIMSNANRRVSLLVSKHFLADSLLRLKHHKIKLTVPRARFLLYHALRYGIAHAEAHSTHLALGLSNHFPGHLPGLKEAPKKAGKPAKGHKKALSAQEKKMKALAEAEARAHREAAAKAAAAAKARIAAQKAKAAARAHAAALKAAAKTQTKLTQVQSAIRQITHAILAYLGHLNLAGPLGHPFKRSPDLSNRVLTGYGSQVEVSDVQDLFTNDEEEEEKRESEGSMFYGAFQEKAALTGEEAANEKEALSELNRLSDDTNTESVLNEENSEREVTDEAASDSIFDAVFNVDNVNDNNNAGALSKGEDYMSSHHEEE
ncbi:uncharacterized protein LOC135829051 isoform X2 [Sycon ciliatum]|uniref:uncharacterized protein LOC135829051 isoform X2 n=1 Tax=Sycon ciliatum TaxID=27933 RepID=UPI0020ABD977|eukprot:scpid81084/ scgid4814/ 